MGQQTTIEAMAGYEKLLEATIQHLEELKGRGGRFVLGRPERVSASAASKIQRPAFATQKPASAKQFSELKESKPEPAKTTAGPALSFQTAGRPLPMGL